MVGRPVLLYVPRPHGHPPSLSDRKPSGLAEPAGRPGAPVGAHARQCRIARPHSVVFGEAFGLACAPQGPVPTCGERLCVGPTALLARSRRRAPPTPVGRHRPERRSATGRTWVGRLAPRRLSASRLERQTAKRLRPRRGLGRPEQQSMGAGGGERTGLSPITHTDPDRATPVLSADDGRARLLPAPPTGAVERVGPPAAALGTSAPALKAWARGGMVQTKTDARRAERAGRPLWWSCLSEARQAGNLPPRACPTGRRRRPRRLPAACLP
jgi:hypothetical protein